MIKPELHLENIVILKELQNLMPSTVDEKRLLEESIIDEGLKEPLEVWNRDQETILIDGHNRLDILKRIGYVDNIKYKILKFRSIEEAQEYALKKQFSRRNLTDISRTYLIGILYNKHKTRRGGVREGQIDVAKNLAERFNVSVRTIKKAGDYTKGIDKLPPLERESVLSGDVKITKRAIENTGRKRSKTTTLKRIRKGNKRQLKKEWTQTTLEEQIDNYVEVSSRILALRNEIGVEIFDSFCANLRHE